MGPTSYIAYSVILVVWCIIHSLLITNKFIACLKRKLDAKFRFYRLLYNLFSLITFIPIIIYAEFIGGDLIFVWKGYLHIIQGLILFSSFYLFIAGSRHYDGLVFLGISQIRKDMDQKSLTSSGDLNISGILGIIRHPWYSGSILLIWSRNLDVIQFITNIILTFYLIIGSYLEEKKLEIEFGEKYRLYKQQVSMLFPYKWLVFKIIKRNIV